MAQKQVEHIRNQYGKLISKDEVGEEDEITGSFELEQANIDNEATFSLNELKRKTDIKKFVGKKVGDKITLKTKNLFADGKEAAVRYLGVSEEIAETLDVEVEFIIDEINTRELAELNQELFDKIFGENEVQSEEELNEKIKEEGEKQVMQQSNQKRLDDIVEALIENTKFDLPSEFLQRWIQANAEEKISIEEAEEEYNKSEKGFRYQLIKAKKVKENKIYTNFTEV